MVRVRLAVRRNQNQIARLDVLGYESIQLSFGDLPARLIEIDVSLKVFPSDAVLRVVLVKQGLKNFAGLRVGQNTLPFIRGSIHILRFPDQGHSQRPVAFKDGLGFGCVVKDGGKPAKHFLDVMVVHRGGVKIDGWKGRVEMK